MVDVLRKAALTEEQAREIYRQGPEAVVFALLVLTKQLAEARGRQSTPSTPSGMVPVYEKPTVKGRKKRPAFKRQIRRMSMKTVMSALIAMAVLVGVASAARADSDGWSPQGFWQQAQDRLP